jgi:uncharacterized protein YegP (UPF0339 family)
MVDRREVYKDKKDEWRWRVIAPNNRIVQASTEGFKTKAAAIKNAQRKRPK